MTYEEAIEEAYKDYCTFDSKKYEDAFWLIDFALKRNKDKEWIKAMIDYRFEEFKELWEETKQGYIVDSPKEDCIQYYEWDEFFGELLESWMKEELPRIKERYEKEH